MNLVRYCWILIVSSILMIVSGTVMGVETIRAASIDGSNIQMRVGEYNIASRSSATQKQAQLISQQRLDAVGLIEVDENTNRNKVDMLGTFGKIAGMTNTYFGKTLDFEGGQYGIGIASRLPFAEQSMTIYPYIEGQDESMGYQRIVYTIDGVKIAFYNTHLQWQYTQRPIRDQQMAYLKQAVLNDPVPYKIIVGDFNTDDSKDEWDIWKQDFNLGNGGSDGWKDTFNVQDSTMRNYAIDNIVTSKNIDIKNFDILRYPDLSDHFPVVADLTLKDAFATSGRLDQAKKDGENDGAQGKPLNSDYSLNNQIQEVYAKSYQEAKGASVPSSNGASPTSESGTSSSSASSSSVSSSSSSSVNNYSSSYTSSSPVSKIIESRSKITVISSKKVHSLKKHQLRVGAQTFIDTKLTKPAGKVSKQKRNGWRVIRKETVKISGKKYVYYQMQDQHGLKVWVSSKSVK